MEFSKSDKIEFQKDKVLHESAGGFVFYESPKDHVLYVALLQKPDGKFFIPKGHLHNGEKPKETAIREVMEELCLNERPEIRTKIGIDNYDFTLPEDERIHHKNVHLYVFSLAQKSAIKPLEKEDFVDAKWLEFKEALEKIAFDRDNLLMARQLFYFNKPVPPVKEVEDIKSFTVGIPTHNGSITIYNTLSSIVESLSVLPKSISKKIIVCLDHCNDNTESVVDNFFEKNKRNDIEFKRIINTGQKGKSTVLNKIFENTDSELLCFIDDDVLLGKDCIHNLIKTLIDRKDLRCVFARWVRRPFSGKSPWKRFWHWVLGVKFDIQLFDSRPEYMRGACMMFRRQDFVYLPDKKFNVLNEDQFLQFIYWPLTKEVDNAVIYFNSVCTITEYYKRFIRISAGFKQVDSEFSVDRVKKCYSELNKKINYKNVWKSPLKRKLPFLLYRFIRIFVNNLVKIKLKRNKNYEWFRFEQHK